MRWHENCYYLCCDNINQLDMKKILFTLIALMAVMTVQAQSICSTWRSMQPVVETDADGSFNAQNLTYTFNEDGTYYFVDELTLSTQPSQTMALEIATNIEVKGTYVLEGDKLTLNPDINTYKTELLSISMNGHVADDPNIKSTVEAMVNSADFKSQFAETETNTVKVGDSMLEMSQGDQTITFMRFATIKNN